MENFIEHRTCTTPPASSPHLSFHNNSRAISKSKPKVRIIHIFAPEIIKTDVANFRELVQRLTGKPTARDRARRKNKSRRPRDAKRPPADIISVSGENPAPAPTNRLVEFRRSAIKEEGDDEYGEDQVMWADRNYFHHNGGDENPFGDLDGLIQELGHDQFSFLHNLDGPNYNLQGFAHQLCN